MKNTTGVAGGQRLTRFTKGTPRLPVADLRSTIAFYTEVLGFRVGVLWPDDHPTFTILSTAMG